jgi:hypothetical protein
VNIRKVIQRRIRLSREGVDVAGDVNAVISANVGRDRSTTSVSSKQRTGGVDERRTPEEAQEEGR